MNSRTIEILLVLRVVQSIGSFWLTLVKLPSQ